VSGVGAVLAGVAVGLAVLAAVGPGRRRTSVVAGDAGACRRPGRLVRGRPGRGPRRPLEAVLTEVTGLLATGSTPARAWREVLGVPAGADGVPRPEDLAGPVRRRTTDDASVHARAVVAAARLAAELGAPLGDVLDRVTASVVADVEAADDRRAALAGPRSTALVLQLLPVLGLAVGAGLGADPVGVLVGGGIGSVAGVTGLALLLVGRAWTRVLVRAAERAGDA